MNAPDKVTQYMIALYLAAGGSVNEVRRWIADAKAQQGVGYDENNLQSPLAIGKNLA